MIVVCHDFYVWESSGLIVEDSMWEGVLGVCGSSSRSVL